MRVRPLMSSGVEGVTPNVHCTLNHLWRLGLVQFIVLTDVEVRDSRRTVVRRSLRSGLCPVLKRVPPRV